MGTAHVDYKPTEYEEMLIAAKWISIEDIDAEYGEYTHGNDCAYDYKSWKAMRARWNELNAEYSAVVDPYYRHDSDMAIPYDVQQLGNRLLNEMCSIEVTLGY